jgi:hypothetical protein
MVAYKPENRFRLLLATDSDVLHSKRLHAVVKEWPNPVLRPPRRPVHAVGRDHTSSRRAQCPVKTLDVACGGIWIHRVCPSGTQRRQTGSQNALVANRFHTKRFPQLKQQ